VDPPTAGDRDPKGLDHQGTVRLAVSDFATEKGEPLTGWAGAKKLGLDSKGRPGEGPIFGEFRWM
jgi:hypothetical protein